MDPADQASTLRRIGAWLAGQGIDLWGVADLTGIPTPLGPYGEWLPRAIALALPMDPSIMAGIAGGPTAAYAQAYRQANRRIDQLSRKLVRHLSQEGLQAWPLPVSERSDPIAIRGAFPHKTAATRAGLGWIGRHCQLVTRRHGPWIRLGTVFTDLSAPCGPPVEKSGCGRCQRCVDACPAGALTGCAWTPGLAREAILDAARCDHWKQTHYRPFNHGHNCGICAAVCPFGK